MVGMRDLNQLENCLAQIERMKTVRDHYIARQAHEAKVAREKGEVRATSSVMRLGLIGKEGGSDSESSSAPSSSPPPDKGGDNKRGEKKEKSD